MRSATSTRALAATSVISRLERLDWKLVGAGAAKKFARRAIAEIFERNEIRFGRATGERRVDFKRDAVADEK